MFRLGTKIFSKTKFAESYLLTSIYKSLHRKLKSDFAKVQGHKMYLDEDDSLRLSIFGVYEPSQTELIKQEVKEGDIVLDIGANIGYYTLIFAKMVGPSGKVYAFEPDPKNFLLLKKNVKINNYDNVVLINKAISDKAEKIKLYFSNNNKASHTIYGSEKDTNFVAIDSIKLDDYFKMNEQDISFVKIDVEGAEYKVLQGMKKLLEKSKNNFKIITEFCPAWLKRGGIDPKSYLMDTDTIEEKIQLLQDRKKELINMVVGEMEPIKKLTRADIEFLFNE